MDNYTKIPKYIEKELLKASEYANKSHVCIEKFMQWVITNVDPEFDFETLRAQSHASNYDDLRYQTEALTEVEYGHDVDIDAIERTINYFKGKNSINEDIPIYNIEKFLKENNL